MEKETTKLPNDVLVFETKKTPEQRCSECARIRDGCYWKKCPGFEEIS